MTFETFLSEAFGPADVSGILAAVLSGGFIGAFVLTLSPLIRLPHISIVFAVFAIAAMGIVFFLFRGTLTYFSSDPLIQSLWPRSFGAGVLWTLYAASIGGGLEIRRRMLGIP